MDFGSKGFAFSKCEKGIKLVKNPNFPKKVQNGRENSNFPQKVKKMFEIENNRKQERCFMMRIPSYKFPKHNYQKIIELKRKEKLR